MFLLYQCSLDGCFELLLQDFKDADKSKILTDATDKLLDNADENPFLYALVRRNTDDGLMTGTGFLLGNSGEALFPSCDPS